MRFANPSILFAALFLISQTAFANNYLFKVLASQGTNQFKPANQPAWVSVKAGTKLNSGDLIRLTGESYLGLVHTSGRTMELTKPKQVKVDDLAAELREKGTNVVSKYADFVLNRLSETRKERENNLSATGAVTRTTGPATSIKVLMPSFVEVMNRETLVRWRPVEGSPTYVIVLKNIFDDVIAAFETQRTSVRINLARPEFTKERLVVLTIFLKGNEDFKSEDYGLKPLIGENDKYINETYINLSQALSESNSINQIMLAGFFEENNLLMNALTSYQKAIDLSPQVDDYKEMYEAFVYRHQLGH